jgi:hypothetical protein
MAISFSFHKQLTRGKMKINGYQLILKINKKKRLFFFFSDARRTTHQHSSLCNFNAVEPSSAAPAPLTAVEASAIFLCNFNILPDARSQFHMLNHKIENILCDIC